MSMTFMDFLKAAAGGLGAGAGVADSTATAHPFLSALYGVGQGLQAAGDGGAAPQQAPQMTPMQAIAAWQRHVGQIPPGPPPISDSGVTPATTGGASMAFPFGRGRY